MATIENRQPPERGVFLQDVVPYGTPDRLEDLRGPGGGYPLERAVPRKSSAHGGWRIGVRSELVAVAYSPGDFRYT